ncbi:periplasmic chaperone for outer membrane proteins Skp [Sinomicrobium oceani]|uniref:Periplasmic chaperone for outer membrane proteins Skp n=1 Tax=Sinomicrobium oceani TaxID=1150368 RepID=A0A1K1R8J9_9FLAO|nr:OmpH family outer membrane protein [Sinomicrobium oceani]SFW68228.1 periplasmic chaperone for outer membrane proteins Skp [Sinomicrobium oceani]
MKKLLLPLTVLALILSVCALGWSLYSRPELVYVDVNKLLDGYKRSETEREKFKEKAALLKANIDSLVTGWQKELKNYEKERETMSARELKLKQELLSNKQQQVNNYQQAIQRQIQEEDQKMTQTVINDINDYVKDFGKRKGYRIIFGASGSGNIMYASDAADLTEEILDGLNREYEGK